MELANTQMGRVATSFVVEWWGALSSKRRCGTRVDFDFDFDPNLVIPVLRGYDARVSIAAKTGDSLAYFVEYLTRGGYPGTGPAFFGLA